MKSKKLIAGVLATGMILSIVNYSSFAEDTQYNVNTKVDFENLSYTATDNVISVTEFLKDGFSVRVFDKDRKQENLSIYTNGKDGYQTNTLYLGNEEKEIVIRRTDGSAFDLTEFDFVVDDKVKVTSVPAPATTAPATEEPATTAPTFDTTAVPTTESSTEPATTVPTVNPTNEPSTNAPMLLVEDPTSQEPASENPSTDAPSTDAPGAEDPSTDAPSTDAPSEIPGTEQPTVEPTPIIPAKIFASKKVDLNNVIEATITGVLAIDNIGLSYKSSTEPVTDKLPMPSIKTDISTATQSRNPSYSVEGAMITLYRGDKVLDTAIVKDGKYKLNFTRQQPYTTLTLVATKEGYQDCDALSLTTVFAKPTIDKVTKKSTFVSGKGYLAGAKVKVYKGKTKLYGKSEVKKSGYYVVKLSRKFKKGSVCRVKVFKGSKFSYQKVKVK